jgi:hypothetical protein
MEQRMTERTYTADEVDAMIARAVAAAKPANTLHFAQWTNGEKDLSNYILVGEITLGRIEDGEYEQSEIDTHENTIEALQERLVTGDERKGVPLLAYIGGLNTTPPAQPAPDLSKLKPENAQQMREWIADGSFTQRAIDTMFELSQEITALKKEQLVTVQEPVFCEYCGGNDDADFGLPTDHCTDCARPQPAAQPAVPDAFGTREGEHPQYIQGWNDCRAEMLSMRKRVKP